MSATIEVTDQMNRKVIVASSPKRIISLVPSQTELLYHLGLRERVVGVTKFCIYPKAAREEKTIVGGTKNVRLEKLLSLEPDLIIGNKEENTEAIITQLQNYSPVWMSDISTLDDALNMITQLGLLLGVHNKARTLVSGITKEFQNFHRPIRSKVLYFIWKNPLMVAGTNTFIHSMLEKMSHINVVAPLERYPTLDEDSLKNLDPDVVMLSSEPYPFKEKHKSYFQKLFPNAVINLVNGEYFSWYGSRLIDAPNYFKTLNFKV
ncbi:MAG: helical backbone metal receptor [Bacteroidota bacterium]